VPVCERDLVLDDSLDRVSPGPDVDREVERRLVQERVDVPPAEARAQRDVVAERLAHERRLCRRAHVVVVVERDRELGPRVARLDDPVDESRQPPVERPPAQRARRVGRHRRLALEDERTRRAQSRGRSICCSSTSAAGRRRRSGKGVTVVGRVRRQGATSIVVACATSIVVACATSIVVACAAPIVVACAAPIVVAYATPIVVACATPIVVACAAPIVVAYAATPIVVACAAPIVVACAAPIVVAYATPIVVAYATPIVVACAAPIVVAYAATPIVVACATPIVVAYATPIVVAYATPIVVAYAAPIVVAYATPIVVACAAPIVVAYATPIAASCAAPIAASCAAPIAASSLSSTFCFLTRTPTRARVGACATLRLAPLGATISVERVTTRPLAQMQRVVSR